MTKTIQLYSNINYPSNSRIVKYMTKTIQLYSNINYPKLIQNMIFAFNFIVFSLQTLVTIMVLEQNSFKFQSQRQKYLVFDFLANDLRLIKSCLFVHMHVQLKNKITVGFCTL